MKRTVLIVAVTVSSCLISVSTAVAGGEEDGHADALVSQSALNADRLITGAIDFKEFAVSQPSQRAYENDLEEPFADADLLVGGQGFVSLSDQNAGDLLPPRLTNLPGDTDLRFDFRAFEIDGTSANLWFWDGNGGVDFAPASGVTLTYDRLGAFQATVDGSDNDVPGFVIETTASDGSLHVDLDVILDDSDADPNTAVPLGIYAVAWTAYHNPASPPAYVLYNTLGEAGEPLAKAAEAYFDEFVVPEPATLGLLGFGMLLATRRRRCGRLSA